MAKTYALLGVKAHVRAAANYFGNKHGINTIGGVGPGSVPGSDHPAGLALDFMTRNKAQGDPLAADVIANYKQWNVKYVIWWRRIWSPEKGWRSYSGPSAHTDHVHVSFNADGKAPDVSTIPVGGNPLVPDSLENVGKAVAAFNKWVSDPAMWRKLGLYMMGTGMIGTGLILLSLRPAASVASAVIPVGRAVKAGNALKTATAVSKVVK